MSSNRCSAGPSSSSAKPVDHIYVPDSDEEMDAAAAPIAEDLSDLRDGPSDTAVNYESVEQVDSHFYCSICYTYCASAQARVLPKCGHVFCIDSWTAWVATLSTRTTPQERLPKCPTCSQLVGSRPLKRVEFRGAPIGSDHSIVTQLGHESDALLASTIQLKAKLARLKKIRDESKAQLARMRYALENVDVTIRLAGLSLGE
ncbi:hypothetical protein FRC07_012427 [Ceratobasidium sp. 392]|nr:hypothetical protein FRC07_012427 [Ceratobasidium sp. 392]